MKNKVSRQCEKDIEAILKHFTSKKSSSSIPLGDATRRLPRYLQNSINRFVGEVFTVSEVVSRALSLKEMIETVKRHAR